MASLYRIFGIHRPWLQDILDTDLFWDKELLRADEDLLFSCAVSAPQGVTVFENQIQGSRQVSLNKLLLNYFFRDHDESVGMSRHLKILFLTFHP